MNTTELQQEKKSNLAKMQDLNWSIKDIRAELKIDPHQADKAALYQDLSNFISYHNKLNERNRIIDLTLNPKVCVVCEEAIPVKESHWESCDEKATVHCFECGMKHLFN